MLKNGTANIPVHAATNDIDGDMIGDVWEDLKARMRSGACSLKAASECGTTSYHGGSMHPAGAARRTGSAPYAATHHAQLVDSNGNHFALGRLTFRLFNVKHGCVRC